MVERVKKVLKLLNHFFLFISLWNFPLTKKENSRCRGTLMGMPLHNLIKSVDENVIKHIHAVTNRKNVAST